MDCAIYLRKSRADIEAEARGEGETLARHESTLIELASKKQINIIKIYKEIVSGENIAARPQMQSLLEDVSNGNYDGVLVMEIERLARGDTIDQGVVAQAFKSSDTKIITPAKIYDPNNEFDEEYFEFGLFMSRREYKTIRRRMNAGRLAAVKEGNYIVSSAPYGYKKINPEPKVHTLEIIPEEAKVVNYIFDEYLKGKGSRKIAADLNEMSIQPSKSKQWIYISVKKILKNPVYAGLLTWKTKGMEDQTFQGKHEPIISLDKYEKVQAKRESSPLASNKRGTELKNYYQGLLFCKNCGRSMLRRDIKTPGGSYEHMLCRSPECRGIVVSSRVENIDELVINLIKIKLLELKHKKGKKETAEDNSINTKISLLSSELTKLKNQQNRLYDFLEQGIYDTNTYLERSALINSKITENQKKIAELELTKKVQVQSISKDEMIIRLENILDKFDDSNVKQKNSLLKSAIKRIEYSKTKRMCCNDMSSDLEIFVEFL